VETYSALIIVSSIVSFADLFPDLDKLVEHPFVAKCLALDFRRTSQVIERNSAIEFLA
jgi:hypothetical protein